jgi:hypothetical protein
MTSTAGFGSTQLFVTDSRLVLELLNHLRHRALQQTLGVSREQANLLTAVAVLTAVDATYESARRVAALRPRVAGSDAALGALALRELALGVTGPNVRNIPGLGTLVACAFLGAVAAPRLQRGAMRMRAAQQTLRAAEQRIRRERISRYAAAREGARA